ncbi:SOSS complex subunit C-like [Dreissena polymorpha]|uniref:SOSS complex subunit C n=1 Tax=Dreissena polymorpha TaxID=45954 RepID=A0A9D4G307_DREPO|nr:SOSS complex subunit C-like [Dreissena polymorpha]KAH3809217.1 hypothetical protein DPMN_137578 [Dreissena polymorpha]
MAFQPPNTGQERQNRKILEQLEEQKKRLRMGGSAAPSTPPVLGLSPTPGAPAPSIASQTMVLPETQPMNPEQRKALQHANANSFGYFITQDSSFGNLILPVLPRFDGPKT